MEQEFEASPKIIPYILTIFNLEGNTGLIMNYVKPKKGSSTFIDLIEVIPTGFVSHEKEFETIDEAL